MISLPIAATSDCRSGVRMKQRLRIGIVIGLALAYPWLTVPIFAACCGDTSKSDLGDAEQLRPPFDYEHNVTGDWFGLRNTLYNYGLAITGSYTTEPAGNPFGGLDRGETYLDNFGFAFLFDFNKIFGLSGTTFLITISQRTGRSLSADFIGNAISVQQIFGGGETFRLVQMRLDQKFLDDRLELIYGRLSTTADFMTSQFYCQFVTNGICGQPTAPFFNMPNGLTAYPGATWGTVAQFNSTKEIYEKFGVYDGDPNHGYDRHGANFNFGENGALFLAEVGYKSSNGLLGMPCRYSLGGFHHTGDFPDVAEDGHFNNLFISGRPARLHSGQSGFYLVFEQMLIRNPGRPESGLNAFTTFVVSPDEQKSAMPYFFNGGLIYDGLIPSRPHDKTALGFYSTIFSEDLRSAERAAGLPSQTSETDIELNHQLQINQWLYCKPNLQYVIKPNGLNTIDNAFVAGLEIGLTF
jgi:porin